MVKFGNDASGPLRVPELTSGLRTVGQKVIKTGGALGNKRVSPFSNRKVCVVVWFWFGTGGGRCQLRALDQRTKLFKRRPNLGAAFSQVIAIRGVAASLSAAFKFRPKPLYSDIQRPRARAATRHNSDERFAPTGPLSNIE